MASFVDALVASRRSPELDDADDLFGFLIGHWSIQALLYSSDGRVQRSTGDIYASWVLEGRAIQDLFIFASRYSTTLRTYDRGLRAWRVRFVNPIDDETSAELVARRRGPNIEMDGKLSGGTPVRWWYETITPTSFHYRAERQESDGQSWRLYLELLGKR
ncbi:MAG TPA: hypothetical protein VFA43_01405 [Gemmatimonadaceae bacterium]|nr:hypothetical protein [Gemmatimonadaceae bacterium]